MANRHQHARAYFDLYAMMEADQSINGVNMCACDTASQKLSDYFLRRSAALGYKQARYLVQSKENPR
jgi:hypothetical protein